MSTAEKIFTKTQALPEPTQAVVLQIVELLATRYPSAAAAAPPMELHEAAELRGKLAASEEDWNAPGMEAYDRP